MTLFRVILVLMLAHFLSGCCETDITESEQTMYLESISSTSRDIVEYDLENSIIDGNAYPTNFETIHTDQSYFSFFDKWKTATPSDQDYGKWFFDSIPKEQDLFLTFNLALDRDLSDMTSVKTDLYACDGTAFFVGSPPLYKNSRPVVADNLSHIKLSFPITILIDVGIIPNADTNKDICINIIPEKTSPGGFCAVGEILHFNLLEISGSKVSQVLNDLEAQGVLFDYPSNDINNSVKS